MQPRNQATASDQTGAPGPGGMIEQRNQSGGGLASQDSDWLKKRKRPPPRQQPQQVWGRWVMRSGRKGRGRRDRASGGPRGHANERREHRCGLQIWEVGGWGCGDEAHRVARRVDRCHRSKRRWKASPQRKRRSIPVDRGINRGTFDLASPFLSLSLSLSLSFPFLFSFFTPFTISLRFKWFGFVWVLFFFGFPLFIYLSWAFAHLLAEPQRNGFSSLAVKYILYAFFLSLYLFSNVIIFIIFIIIIKYLACSVMFVMLELADIYVLIFIWIILKFVQYRIQFDPVSSVSIKDLKYLAWSVRTVIFSTNYIKCYINQFYHKLRIKIL